MIKPKCFFEPFCGSAAVTLRLLGGQRANPPIAYMGSKRGYAAYILANMGLRGTRSTSLDSDLGAEL